MGREASIDEHEVYQVYDQVLLEQGTIPSNTQVRQRLGDRGSSTTIQKYRERWISGLGDRLVSATEITGLPEGIAAEVGVFVNNLWQKAVGQVESGYREQKQQLERFKEVTDRDIATAREQMFAAEQKAETLQERLDSAEQKARELETALAVAQGRKEEVEGFISQARKDADDARSQANARVADIEKALILERKRSDDKEEMLVAKLDEQMLGRRQLEEIMQQKEKRWKAEQTESTEKLIALQKNLGHKEGQCSTLETTLSELKQNQQTLREQHDQQQTRLGEMNTKLSEREKQIGSLEKTLGHNADQLHALQQQLADAGAENKVLKQQVGELTKSSKRKKE